MTPRLAIRIALIDDDDAFCRRVVGWLAPQHYDVVHFRESAAGIEHVRASQPELVLIDLRMPDMEASAAIRLLTRAAPRTRVLASSAFPDVRQVLEAVRAGARDVLEKPLQSGTLTAALERHLQECGLAMRAETDFNRALGQRLSALRKAASLQLKQVAARCGVSAAQLSQIEHGKTATSTWTLARICAALRRPLREVFEDF